MNLWMSSRAFVKDATMKILKTASYSACYADTQKFRMWSSHDFGHEQ